MVFGAVSTADSFGALLETVPHGYCAVLKPLLRNLIDVSEKLGNVEARLAKLVAHQQNGSWPPKLLTVGVPRWQFTKEFAAQAEHLARLNGDIKEFHKDLLTKEIEACKLEIECLCCLSSADSFRKPMQKACDDYWVDMQVRRGVRGEIPLPEELASLSGPLVSDGKAFDSFLPREYSRVKKLLPPWNARAVDLGAVKFTVQKQAFEHNQKFKQKADANMVDADEVARNEALRAEIRLALKEEQKKQKVSTVRETDEGTLSNMTLGKRQRQAKTGAQPPAQSSAEKRQKIAQTQSFVRGWGQSTAHKRRKRRPHRRTEKSELHIR